MQKEIAMIYVRVLVKVIDALGIKRRTASLNTMDYVAFLKQQLCQIRAILPGNAGDQGNFL